MTESAAFAAINARAMSGGHAPCAKLAHAVGIRGQRFDHKARCCQRGCEKHEAFDGHAAFPSPSEGLNGRAGRFMICASAEAPGVQSCPRMGLAPYRSSVKPTAENPVIAEPGLVKQWFISGNPQAANGGAAKSR